jgi:hypothetical protein
MRIVHFSGESLSYGIKEKKLEGITVRGVERPLQLRTGSIGAMRPAIASTRENEVG